MDSASEFLEWEAASRDTVDVKRVYIDVAGDLVAGVLLSQVVFWFLPSQQGSKLRVEHDGALWLAKGRADWWDECRLTPKQYDRAITVLRNAGLVETRLFKFAGVPTVHIWLDVSALMERVKSILTKGENPFSPNVETHFDLSSKSSTESTTETTAQTDSGSSSADHGSEGKIESVTRAYSENVGPLTPVIRADIEAAVAEYGVQPVLGAIAVAARANDHTWRYVEGVLKRSRAGQKMPEADPDKYVRGAFGAVVKR